MVEGCGKGKKKVCGYGEGKVAAEQRLGKASITSAYLHSTPLHTKIITRTYLTISLWQILI